ncbi:MAG: YggS family pyridoxal phosphate-dependent enzyme [Anaerolineales bacterium]|nr:YggS family pyridoxal phosphate-dependent enzyme [Anaerolineales bacterium]
MTSAMEVDSFDNIRHNIARVRERIFKAATKAGRNPDHINIVGVTKEKSAAVVKELVENGINYIGESFLNEALFKIDLLKNFPIQWQMIGTIQNGKEKHIAGNFACVHSVARIATAINLNKYAVQFNRVLPIYLELNVSGESSKHGWPIIEKDDWEQFLDDLEIILDMTSLDVKGLMTMAPYSINPEDARPSFKRLKEVRDTLAGRFQKTNINELSMGMSGDFEVAIEEEATILRIGSALVGPR